jgi:hypothetical protein
VERGGGFPDIRNDNGVRLKNAKPSGFQNETLLKFSKPFLMGDYKDLIVYQKAYKLAMDIFHLTKSFPKEEKYSLTDQFRRSSRSVCAKLILFLNLLITKLKIRKQKFGLTFQKTVTI